jgi:hypothetical protein
LAAKLASRAQLTNQPPNFLSNFLEWPIDRSTRTFRAIVVEPGLYQPTTHGDIFDAALTSLISPQPNLVDQFQSRNSPAPREQFDLLTFPEAFLPMARLLSTLELVRQSSLAGCVHVGLRPLADESNHLFSVAELWILIAGLEKLTSPQNCDLTPFSKWLDQQHEDFRFNVGCFFTVDADGDLRVCLHPKLVRSKFEFNALPEAHMEEANLLTVITLRPVNKIFLTITVQPLLCSDALNLSPDRAVSRPLEAVHKDAACLGNAPPDHIDIVSVATCSPQIEVSPSKSEFYRTWHQDFRDSFLRAAKDDALARHHFAVFVLSNFRMLSEKSPGGLSGAFIPVRPEDIRPEDKPIEFLNISQWGRLKAQDGDSNRWSTPNDDAAQWSGLGYIASLNPFSDGAKGVARMFGFTFPQLPRHMHRWQSKLGLVKYAVKITEPDSSPLTFVSG